MDDLCSNIQLSKKDFMFTFQSPQRIIQVRFTIVIQGFIFLYF